MDSSAHARRRDFPCRKPPTSRTDSLADGDPCRRRKPLGHAPRSPSPALVQQLKVVVGPAAHYVLRQKVAANLLLGADHGNPEAIPGQKSASGKLRRGRFSSVLDGSQPIRKVPGTGCKSVPINCACLYIRGPFPSGLPPLPKQRVDVSRASY